MKHTVAEAAVTVQWGPLITVMLGVFIPAGLAVFAWSVRRIIVRIDSIGDRLEAINVRMAVVETKQDSNAELAETTERVVRKTARKVGLMPRELENTQPHPRLG